jgi:predicted phage terminase large subunit-like protein
MSPSLFAANYELRHIAAEDVIFENANVGADISNVLNANFCHIDAAYGGEDYTAFTICKKKEGKYYVYGKLWQKAIDEVEDQIIEDRKRLLAGKIYCETNADKGYLAKALREKGERVITYAETMNKYIKIVTHLKADWKDVIFVQGTDQEYIDQILDYNEYAEHDDAPDSLACMIRILHPRKDDGVASSFGY